MHSPTADLVKFSLKLPLKMPSLQLIEASTPGLKTALILTTTKNKGSVLSGSPQQERRINLLAEDAQGGGNTSQALPGARVAQPRRHLSAALRAGFPAQQEQLIRLPAPVTCGAGGERGSRERRGKGRLHDLLRGNGRGLPGHGPAAADGALPVPAAFSEG